MGFIKHVIVVIVLYFGLCHGSGCSKTGVFGFFGFFYKNCNTCDVKNATCTSCIDGHHGELCNLTCQNKTYGQNCNFTCGHCLDQAACYHTNGTCPGGCDNGYTGPTCSEACQNKTYGQNCNFTCGHCLDQAACYNTNGTCPDGCNNGYTGPTCSEVCSETTYGMNCMDECSEACVNRTCDAFTGVCKMSQTSNPDSSSNAGGIVGGVFATLLICGLIFAILFYIRRKRQKKSDKQVYEDHDKLAGIDNDAIYLAPDASNSNQHLYEGTVSGVITVQDIIPASMTTCDEQCVYDDADDNVYLDPEITTKGADNLGQHISKEKSRDKDNEDESYYIDPEIHTNGNENKREITSVVVMTTDDDNDYIEPDAFTNVVNISKQQKKTSLVVETENEECEYENYTFPDGNTDVNSADKSEHIPNENEFSASTNNAEVDIAHIDISLNQDDDTRESYYGNIEQEQMYSN